jgi:hypothetical protein
VGQTLERWCKLEIGEMLAYDVDQSLSATLADKLPGLVARNLSDSGLASVTVALVGQLPKIVAATMAREVPKLVRKKHC